MRHSRKLKGEANEILVVTALFILLAFGIFSFSKQTQQSTSYAEWKATCTTSIAGSEKIGGEIICPTFRLDSSPKTEREQMHEIANKMLDCWQVSRKGDLSFDDTKSCMVCQEITFKKTHKLTTQNFGAYLESAKVPGTSLTYADALSNERTRQTNLQADLLQYTPEKLSIVYTYESKSSKAVGAYAQVSTGQPWEGSNPIYALSPDTQDIDNLGAVYLIKTDFSGLLGGWNSGISVIPTEKLKELGCESYPVRQYSER